MPQIDRINRRVLLARRPHGLPVADDFLFDTQPVPEPRQGQVLLHTLYLSLDPYMRNLMDAAGARYAPAVPLGAPMVGATVSRVVDSRNPAYRPGEWVLANAGWQDFAVSDGSDLTLLGDMPQPSLALGALGMTAFTAYFGLLDIGRPRPGETVVVAAATGAVGAVVGQIAKLKGARVVGIAGGPEKSRVAVEDFGFDACLDRHAPFLDRRLAEACANGIDVYFESVGGAVLDAVLPLLNDRARVPVCGVIAHYNDDAPPEGPDRRPELLSIVLQKRIRMQGFVILDHYAERFADFRRDMEAWLAAGQVKARENLVDGLEHAPAAFIGMLQGRNLGKSVVRVAVA